MAVAMGDGVAVGDGPGLADGEGVADGGREYGLGDGVTDELGDGEMLGLTAGLVVGPSVAVGAMATEHAAAIHVITVKAR